jgi:two-component system alkaline phosphatase synthesis response regulator PhoP
MMSDRKALIVDDEFHIVQVVSIKLKNNGFDVLTADNGSSAYEQACEHKPDIIVTDYQMPVMTGLQLIEKLRENPKTEHIPVIMLTARGFAVEDEMRERLRVSACLSKPFSPREVLQIVEEVLEQGAAV